MMGSIGAYLIGIVAAAMIVSVVTGLFDPKTLQGNGIRILAGLVMIMTIAGPILRLREEPIWDLTDSYTDLGKEAARKGEQAAREMLAGSIKQQAEEYILDKAAAMGAALGVEVTVSPEGMPVPAGVRLWGDISPYARLRLGRIIEEDLGIAEKEQIWTLEN